MNRFRSLAAVLLLAASACSSHGSSVLPQAAAGSSPAKPAPGKTKATLSIQVPRPGAATSSSRRSPKYVSPSSTQLEVAVNGGTATTYGLTTQSPGCTVQVTTLSCVISIPAPVGQDTFTLTLKDAAGTVLSKNVVSATLTAGQSTPVNVTLAGIPVAVQLVPGVGSHVEGTGNPSWHAPGFSPQAIEVETLDADNNVIIGPGAPKITQVSVTTGSGLATATSAGTMDPDAYVLTPLTGAAGRTVTVSATAQGIALNDGTTSAPITASSNFTFTPAIAVGAGSFLTIYSAETGNLLSEFCVTCGATAPISHIASDSNGTLYVSVVGFLLNPGSEIAVYPPGATRFTTVLSLRNGVTLVDGEAVDKNGTLYVANHVASRVGGGVSPASIVEFPKGATTPSVTITGGVSDPHGVGVDGSGNVYVADSGAINIYGPGNQAGPSKTITDPSLADPFGIAVDSAGDFYVSDVTNFDIAYFSAGSTSVTSTLYDGSFSNWNGNGPLMLDPNGNLWTGFLEIAELERLDASALPNNVSIGENIQLQTFQAFLHGTPVDVSGDAAVMAWIP